MLLFTIISALHIMHQDIDNISTRIIDKATSNEIDVRRKYIYEKCLSPIDKHHLAKMIIREITLQESNRAYSKRHALFIALKDAVDEFSKEDTIDFLIKNINYVDPSLKSSPNNELRYQYPAIEALLRIGQPAVQKIIEIEKMSDAVDDHAFSSYIIEKYYSKKNALLILNHELETQRNMPLTKRKRLVRILEIIEN